MEFKYHRWNGDLDIIFRRRPNWIARIAAGVAIWSLGFFIARATLG